MPEPVPQNERLESATLKIDHDFPEHIRILQNTTTQAPCRHKLHTKLKNLHVESQLSSFFNFRDLSTHTDGRTWLDRLG